MLRVYQRFTLIACRDDSKALLQSFVRMDGSHQGTAHLHTAQQKRIPQEILGA